MIVKVEIGMESLCDIAEKACEVYRQDLAEAEGFRDIHHIFGCLSNVIRLWEAVEDKFDYDDELVLTLERQEKEEDGTDRAD